MTMPMWQTMETAPKDGRRILVVWDGVTRIVYWDSTSEYWWTENNLHCGKGAKMTYWVEIPSHLKDKSSNG